MSVASVTGAEGMGQKVTSRNKPQTVNETEKRYDYISYYDPVIGHQIASSLTVTVNRGNTLWDIINHQYGDLSGPEMADKIEQIKKINKLTDPNKLSVGQDLVLPDPDLKLGKNYINKCRNTNKNPNVRTRFCERQAVLIRNATPEEIPNTTFNSVYNPELGTIKLNQSDHDSYWAAKLEDETKFEKGSQEREKIFKKDLSNLFRGTGTGDVVVYAQGVATKSSREFYTVKPYLTRAKRVKYRVPKGKWGNIKLKDLTLEAKEFKARYFKMNFKANLLWNIVAAAIDLGFEGLYHGDWEMATLHAIKSLAEGIIVSLATTAINAQIIGALTAAVAPAEALAGPPGWIVLVAGGLSLVAGGFLLTFVNWADAEMNKILDPLIFGKERYEVAQ
jgi:LysM repeat protein